MLERLSAYLKSKRFKRHAYTASMMAVFGVFLYEVATFNKPMFKTKRKETGGYDGHDD